MKKIILILCLLFSLFGLYANDTYFFMAGGQLVPTKEGNVDVEMSEEIINIVLNPKDYEITVDFSFYNYGKDISLLFQYKNRRKSKFIVQRSGKFNFSYYEYIRR